MDFTALVQDCAAWAAPQTMAAIVKRETQFNPLTIGINGGSRLERQPRNKEEAVSTANWLITNGYNVDLGLAQINVKNLVKLRLSVSDAFDPCRNIAAGATLLSWNYQTARSRISGEQPALLAAISMYNTGSMSAGFSNGYVSGVVANAQKQSGKLAQTQSTAGRASAQKTVQQSGLVSYQESDGTIQRTSEFRLRYE